MNTKSRIARSIPQDESPLRHLPFFDPAEAIFVGLADPRELVRIATPDAGLQFAVALKQFRRRGLAAPEPEIPLLGAAREHQVTGLLDFFPQRRVARFLDARRATGGRGDGNENVVLRPRDIAIAVEQVSSETLNWPAPCRRAASSSSVAPPARRPSRRRSPGIQANLSEKPENTSRPRKRLSSKT